MLEVEVGDMLDTSGTRLTPPPRPDHAPPSPRPHSGRRLAVIILASALLAATAIYAGRGRDGTEPRASAAPSTSAGSIRGAGGNRYSGPLLSFEIPANWHEFYLDAQWDFSAAYGPVEGGNDDFVAVGPVDPATIDLDVESLLATAAPRSTWTGPITSVDVNGLAGYRVPVALRQLEGQQTLVIGRQGRYLIGCSTGAHIAARVMAGCDSIAATFAEEPAPQVSEPSGCSARELELLGVVAIPSGTVAGDPASMGTWGGPHSHLCDVMVRVDGYEGDILEYFGTSLAAAGWSVEPPRKDRTSNGKDVWQLIASDDWDMYMVEAYVYPAGASGSGTATTFFITVCDG